MTILNNAFASGGNDVIIKTIELSCDAWSEKLLLCEGFEDQICIDENEVELHFIASGMTTALPMRNATGSQVLTFAIDNVTGEAQALIDSAIDAGEEITLIFRFFMASDKTEPASRPLKFIVREGSFSGSTVQLNAAFFDLINTAWPRRFYTLDFAPGLRYFT